MYAVEFETQLKNGSISVPDVYQKGLTGQVKVIILKETANRDVWPYEIMAFQGFPDIQAFESYRDELQMPPADPLS